MLLDCNGKRVRISKEDISDKSEFAEEYKKLAEQKRTISRDSFWICDDNYYLSFDPVDKEDYPDLLMIGINPGNSGVEAHREKLYLGLPHDRFFSYAVDSADISAVEVNGKSLLRIKIYKEIKDVDAVAVLTPSGNHPHHAAEIAENTNVPYIICEKPISLTVREAEELFNRIDAAGKHLLPVFQKP